MSKLRNKDKLKVSEIFYSIQGEGPTTGTPSVFVRLALCNLACVWCDTKFTWDWANYDAEKEITLMTAEELVSEIQKTHINRKNPNAPHVVITGGEPMLQQQLLIPVLKILRGKGYYVEIETNGTISPILEFMCQVNQFNISPKLENSKNSKKKRFKPKALTDFSMVDWDYPIRVIFKFVISSPEDLIEVKEIVKESGCFYPSVYLMPEGVTSEEIRKKSNWLAEVCKESGFKLCNRLQVAIWDDKRKK